MTCCIRCAENLILCAPSILLHSHSVPVNMLIFHIYILLTTNEKVYNLVYGHIYIFSTLKLVLSDSAQLECKF